MQRTDFAAMACSIARAWNLVGEPWTPIILRDIMLGIRRFDHLQRDLGVSRNVLSARLRTLVEGGVLELTPYSDGRTRHEYTLTKAGAELAPILFMLIRWGDRWCATDDGPPLRLRHEPCGKALRPYVACRACGDEVQPQDVSVRKGPGFFVGPGTLASDDIPG